MRTTLIILLALLGTDTFAQQKNRIIIRKSLSSVCFLMLQDKDDQPKRIGTGFFVKPGVIATSLPLMEGVTAGYCKVAGSRQRHKIQGIIARDVINQVVLLQVDRGAGPVLPMADDGKVLTGDEVTVLSCPKGLNGEFRDGIVSGIHSKDDDKFYEITAGILPSMDGGPVIDAKGEAIGMVASFVAKGKSHTIVIPAYAMKDLLKKIGQPSFDQGNKPVAGNPAGGVPKPLAERFGKSIKDSGVVIKDLRILGAGSRFDGLTFFTCRLQNNLSEPVRGISIFIVAYDKDGSVLTTDKAEFESSQDILPGFTRKATGRCEAGTFYDMGFITQAIGSLPVPLDGSNKRYQIRVMGIIKGRGDGR
jgi:hypothetical protein